MELVMKIFYFALISFCISNQAFANSEGCLSKIEIALTWEALTDSQVECLSTNEEFNVGMNFLCNPDKADLSDKFKRYIYFKQQYYSAFEVFRNATDVVSRNLASMKMNESYYDWTGSGYRAEVDPYLNTLESSKYSCTNK
jgi:hypothetical protein